MGRYRSRVAPGVVARRPHRARASCPGGDERCVRRPSCGVARTRRDTMTSLWAPRAQSVETEIEPAGTQPMARDIDGWWHTDLRPAGRYRYIVDGFAMPDPCSQWQPDGVDGWSHVVDHDAFDWHDRLWTGRSLAGAVIYELHVGTFSDQGTFDGAIEHLDYLVELGVSAIELMPIAEFSGD